jgi:1,4-alpha-glucan branching enzyme
MPVLNQRIDLTTPLGATLVDGGATFRTWAPNALDVYVVTDALAAASVAGWVPNASDRLFPLGDQSWAGYVPGMQAEDPYLFWIRGLGTSGFKRDPYARELGTNPPFPDCPCLVRAGAGYPWHDSGWRPPPFSDLVLYQLHVGTYWSVDAAGHDRRPAQYATFLDLAERIPYLRDLGVNALQLLPIQEFSTQSSLGYNGVDYFSPEMEYQVYDADEIARHLTGVNALLEAAGRAPLSLADLRPGPHQLKCLIDLCHLNGLAVLFDVVYNHAGGDFGDRSLFFYDRQAYGDDNRSLYFTRDGWAGGKVFAYSQPAVRQFLIDNARFFVEEYRVDGLRYDEISVASNFGGDGLCRDLTSTLRFVRPDAIQVAEYWNQDRARAVTAAPDGLGFDAAWADGVRESVRAALGQAASGAGAFVDMDALASGLYPPAGFAAPWRAVQCLENHDVVYWDWGRQTARAPRVPSLADPLDRRSCDARSRSRVAQTLLLSSPGIPMLFMGQEFLEDKPWSDDNTHWARFLIWWDGLATHRAMADFLHFTRDLLWLRRTRAALRGDGMRVHQTHNQDRLLAMHRWVDGSGQDVVVVVSLAEQTRYEYAVDLPWPGEWFEVFNSDLYDQFPNPQVAGNGGHVFADQPGAHGYPYAARMTIPANGALVLARAP